MLGCGLLCAKICASMGLSAQCGMRCGMSLGCAGARVSIHMIWNKQAHPYDGHGCVNLGWGWHVLMCVCVSEPCTCLLALLAEHRLASEYQPT